MKRKCWQIVGVIQLTQILAAVVGVYLEVISAIPSLLPMPALSPASLAWTPMLGTPYFGNTDSWLLWPSAIAISIRTRARAAAFRRQVSLQK